MKADISQSLLGSMSLLGCQGDAGTVSYAGFAPSNIIATGLSLSVIGRTNHIQIGVGESLMLAWLTLAWNIISALFGFGKKDERDVENTEGQVSGAAVQKAQTQSTVITDVEKADEARQTVDATLNSDPDSLRESDGFRRD